MKCYLIRVGTFGDKRKTRTWAGRAENSLPAQLVMPESYMFDECQLDRMSEWMMGGSGFWGGNVSAADVKGSRLAKGSSRSVECVSGKEKVCRCMFLCVCRTARW